MTVLILFEWLQGNKGSNNGNENCHQFKDITKDRKSSQYYTIKVKSLKMPSEEPIVSYVLSEDLST